MNEQHRSLADQLVSAMVATAGTRAAIPGDVGMRSLHDAGSTLTEHYLYLIEHLACFLSEPSDSVPKDAYAALGTTIQELAVMAQVGIEASNTRAVLRST